MVSAQRQIYSLSGGLGNGLFMAPLLGVIAGMLGAFVYAYVNVYSPIVGVISALFVLGLGFGVGTLVGWGGKKGHCRNAMLLHGIGLLVGLVTLYFSWVCFEWVLLRKSGEEGVGFAALVNLALAPGAVWDIARSIAETGWYSVKGADVKGIGSWITWGLEALMLVGLVTLSAGAVLADSVYCERARSWVPKLDGDLRLRIPEDVEVRARLSEGRMEDLESLQRAEDDEFPRLQLDLWHSDQTPETAAYQLKLEVPKVDDGKVTVEQKDLSPCFVATSDEIRRLAALADQPLIPLAEAQAAEVDEPEHPEPLEQS